MPLPGWGQRAEASPGPRSAFGSPLRDVTSAAHDGKRGPGARATATRLSALAAVPPWERRSASAVFK
eukprot:7989487-Alexandrium_andersonii.AAC.1